jgi:hypothetical protein
MGMPLLPLKPMAQLQRGVPHMLEARVHPLVIIWVTPRFDWPISFKSSKGTISWINLSVTTTAGSGYTKIYSNGYAFAATKTDGSISPPYFLIF